MNAEENGKKSKNPFFTVRFITGIRSTLVDLPVEKVRNISPIVVHVVVQTVGFSHVIMKDNNEKDNQAANTKQQSNRRLTRIYVFTDLNLC